MNTENRMSLREAIFDVIQYLTKHALSNQGQKLIIHYFNDSKEDSSYLKALDAIEKYYPESMPAPEERPPKLEKLLQTLKRRADAWDMD